MKLIKVNHKEIGKHYKPTRIASVIDEFIAMNVPAVEVTDFNHTTASSCANSFNSHLKRNNLNHIKAMVVKEKVYLYNYSLIEKEA